MKRFKIKSGDTVQVISGDHKGSQGKILKILKDKNKVLVEAVNMVSRHTKPTAQKPQGGIVKKEAPIHISNVALVENGKSVRVGYRIEADKKVRFSKKSNKAI